MIDLRLKEWATATQMEHIDALDKHRSGRKAAKALGVHHSTLQRSIAAVKRKALLQSGYSPEHGLDHPAPKGMFKGASILFKNHLEEGEEGVSLQWLKIKEEDIHIELKIDEMVEALSIPKFKPTKPPKPLCADTMNVYVFGDPHIDMLSYVEETGHNWDLDIAIHNHMSAMLDLIDRSQAADTGVLCTLGDLFHRDSLKAVTPGSGNIVDVAERLSPSWDRGVEMIRAMIDKMLKKYQTVKYVCVRGNHSPTLELILAKTIRIAYENDPRVVVPDNTMSHIPVQFGKNFLMFTHGDRLSDQKKADIVVSHFREQHGAAKFSHVLSGHLHHAYYKELSGVAVEIFSVLPSPDAWHCESGFMSADRAASVLSYHTAGGIIGRTITNPRIYLKEKTI